MISTVGGILAMVFALIPILGIVGVVLGFVLNVYFAVIMNNVKNAYVAIPPVSSVQEENLNMKEEI